MRALTYQGKERVRHASVPDARIEAPTDALVQVELAGICGSDLHVYHHRERGLDRGTVMGHEFAGRVIAVGGEVSGIRTGDRVACPFTTNCGRCFYCRNGLTCRCVEGELFGWYENGRGLQGAQAELVRVPLASSRLVPVPDDLDAEIALLLGDVLPTGFFCADLAKAGPRGVWVVLGCGPVGLMAIVGARERGAREIVAVDSIRERLALAARFGAEVVRLDREEPGARVRELSGGRGADGVLEAVGSARAGRLALALVRPGGVIAAAGVHHESAFAFAPMEIYDKNLTYRSGRCPARHYMERLLDVVRAGRYDLASVISHRLALSQGEAGYRLFAGRRDGCTKVVLRPG
ncbi:MAG: alcohol dehydrogenase catalytic domain-containing protein [Acidobacteriota bacterium]